MERIEYNHVTVINHPELYENSMYLLAKLFKTKIRSIDTHYHYSHE